MKQILSIDCAADFGSERRVASYSDAQTYGASFLSNLLYSHAHFVRAYVYGSAFSHLCPFATRQAEIRVDKRKNRVKQTSQERLGGGRVKCITHI